MNIAGSPSEAARELLEMARAFELPRPQRDQDFEGSTHDEREADYQSAFDVDGASLYEGFHRPGEGREGIFEDLMRFYAFFDLHLCETERDYPDHLVTELEFLSFLAAGEAEAAVQNRDPRPFQLAQRDFISRHLGIWLPALERRLETAGCESTIYPGLARALRELVDERRDRLEQELQGDMS